MNLSEYLSDSYRHTYRSLVVLWFFRAPTCLCCWRLFVFSNQNVILYSKRLTWSSSLALCENQWSPFNVQVILLGNVFCEHRVWIIDRLLICVQTDRSFFLLTYESRVLANACRIHDPQVSSRKDSLLLIWQPITKTIDD